MDKNIVLSRIKELIRTLDQDAEVILFGSRARGDARDDADWDLLILLPHPTSLQEEQRFRHKLLELELEYGMVISTLVKSKQEWNSKYRVTPLYQNIAAEGIRI